MTQKIGEHEALELLAQDALRGERDRFEHLLTIAWPVIHLKLLRIISSWNSLRSHQDEIVSWVVGQIWFNREQYDGNNRNSLFAWIRAITRDAMIKTYIKEQKRNNKHVNISELSNELIETIDQEMNLEKIETAAMVEACLKELKSNEEAVLRHMFYDEMTHEKISQKLSQSIGNIGRIKKKCLLQLRACLSRKGMT